MTMRCRCSATSESGRAFLNPGFQELLVAAETAAQEARTMGSSSAALGMLLGSREDATPPLNPLGQGAPAPSATTLFNAFVNPNDPWLPRNALQRHYARRFEVIAHPGQMPDVDPRPGDLLLRVARGEGWGHVAVVASPNLYRHDRLADAGLRGEGYPRLRTGLYVQVVELGPRRRRRADRFARRMSDDSGRVLPDTLLLRPLQEAEPEPGADLGRGTTSPAEQRPALRRGDEGLAVEEAQRKLNRVHAELGRPRPARAGGLSADRGWALRRAHGTGRPLLPGIGAHRPGRLEWRHRC